MQGTTWPVFESELELPFAFTWGSDIPHAGHGFNEWSNGIKNVNTSGNILVIRGYFFRDESESMESGKQLGLRRVRRLIRYLQLSEERIIIEVIPRELDADAREHPFAAIDYEELFFSDVVKRSFDTLDVCFPLKNSFQLPGIINAQLEEWLIEHDEQKNGNTHIVGTADGTGIAEATDVAWERALVVKKKLIENGWYDDKIIITTGQRSSTQPVRNRCVIIYFE